MISNYTGILGTLILMFFAQGAWVESPYVDPTHAEQLKREVQWVDSVYATLSLDERVGQMIMIRAHSDLGPDHVSQVENLIREHKVGGLCFFQGTPVKQAELINQYQAISDIPLLVATDAEWGTGMRFKEDGFSFPRALTLGAVNDDRLIYEMGRSVAKQLKACGVNFNFAPVADINNNPSNPVIYDRSFGEDRKNVSQKSYMYMLGMQDEGILACAKHFPGHGDTDVDSHEDLPTIPHTRARLDSVELMPFRILSEQGVGAVMVAHLNLPAFDTEPGLPSTLSRKLVTGLLRNEYGYNGLVVTDAMEMGGVVKYHQPGEAEAKAVQAGNDIILLPKSVSRAVDAIKSYMEVGEIDSTQVATSVKRILRAKYRLGLTAGVDSLDLSRASADALLPEARGIRQKLIEQALTLVANEDDLVPVQKIKERSFAVLTDDLSRARTFIERTQSYVKPAVYDLTALDEKSLKELEEKDVVICGIFNSNKYRGNNAFGLSENLKGRLSRLDKNTELILIHFGSPYALERFSGLKHILQAYEKDQDFQDLAIQAIFGVFDISGALPVTPSKTTYGEGHGLRTQSLYRMGFSVPERMGMSSDTLRKIEELAAELIDEEAAPGFQLLIARNGSVVYQKSFGHHTYKKKKQVEDHHLYDVASLTKVLATTTSVMRLYDEGEVNILRPMGYYLPELRESDKAPLVIEDIMIHSARLHPWIPFYRNVLISESASRPDPKWFKVVSKSPYDVPVAKHMYMRRDYIDSMWTQIVISDLRSRDGYRYSDLGFYMLARLVERRTGLPLDLYADRSLYTPLGLSRTLFNPLQKYPSAEIVPSENDDYFRFQELRGYVHDMGAAMMGGVSGHAGLFSNALEVGVIMQMLMNGGFYGGERFYRPETVALFTARPRKETRRGIGFDMKQLDPRRSPNMSKKASFRTFGHMGFTGTVAWADPTQNLVFVFLSNRTYPSMENRKLITGDYRIKFHDIAYESILPSP